MNNSKFNNTSLFSDKEYYKKLLFLTLPIAFQSLMSSAVAACDSFMLGRVDQNALAAVSLASQIQFVQSLFVFGCAEAAVVLGAQYWGKGNKKAVKEILCIILRVNIFVSVLFCLACEIIPEKLMWLFTNEATLIDIGAQYLRIAGWSYLIVGISYSYLTIMRVSDHATAGSVISSGAVVLNIILNGIFIFGLMGIAPMSANGAALATLIARIIELVMCIVISAGRSYIRPDIKYLLHINKLLSLDFTKIALPLLGGAILWGVGFTAYTSAMGHMGTDATAANAVAAVVRELMCCLCNGIASAGGIIVANELGKGDLAKGKEYGIKTSKLSIIIGFASTLIVIAVIPLVKSFMVLTPEAGRILTGIMVIMGIYMIGRVINTVVINGIFACGGDTLFDMYSLLVCMWCISLPLAFLGVFVFHWSVYLVYTFTVFDELVKLPWVYIHFKKYKWVKDLTRNIEE